MARAERKQPPRSCGPGAALSRAFAQVTPTIPGEGALPGRSETAEGRKVGAPRVFRRSAAFNSSLFVVPLWLTNRGPRRGVRSRHAKAKYVGCLLPGSGGEGERALVNCCSRVGGVLARRFGPPGAQNSGGARERRGEAWRRRFSA